MTSLPASRISTPSRRASVRRPSYLRAWMMARSAPSYSPAAQAQSSVPARRQRAHRSTARSAARHEGSGSPHARHSGGDGARIDAQQVLQTGPDEGLSSGRRQAAQTGDSASVSAMSRMPREAAASARRSIIGRSRGVMRRGDSGEREQSGADDGADPEGNQLAGAEGAFQSVLSFALGTDLLHRFCGEKTHSGSSSILWNNEQCYQLWVRGRLVFGRHRRVTRIRSSRTHNLRHFKTIPDLTVLSL